MSSIEKISIALPQEMVAALRQAVEEGEYASSSEVVRDALRDWTHKRELRQQGIEDLRRAWREAIAESGTAAGVDEVFQRLENKYRARARPSAARKSTRKRAC